MLPIVHPSRSHWTREKMPQIADAAEFEHFLRLHDIGYLRKLKSAAHLHATQNEVNLELVFKIVSSGLNTQDHPLIVSKDGHILDGHNRWYAATILRVDVHCIVVDRDIESLLHFALSLPDVEHASIANTK